MARADGAEGFARIGAVPPLRVGREFDDAQDRAVLRRLKPHRTRGGVRMTVVVGRRSRRLPEIGERESGHRRHFFHVRRGAVGDERRLALRVVPGKDTTYAPDHATASLGAITLRDFTPASGERRKSHSSFRNGLDMPSFFASAALLTFLYLPTSEFLTAYTASSSR